MKQDEVRDGRRPGHFWIDNEILDDYGAKLGAHAMAVYMVLARYSNNGVCFPATSTIGKDLNMSRPTVIKALQALKDAGLILIEERKMPVRGQTSNLYTLLQVCKTGVKEIDSGRVSGVKDVDTPCKAPLHPPVNDVDTNNTNKNKTNLTSGGVEQSGTAAAAEDQEVVSDLMTAGLDRNQAIKAAAMRSYTPTEREQLKHWREQSTARKPGAVLWNCLKYGDLPDDLPPPPQPELSDDERMRQYLEEFSSKPVSPADYRSR